MLVTINRAMCCRMGMSAHACLLISSHLAQKCWHHLKMCPYFKKMMKDTTGARRCSILYTQYICTKLLHTHAHPLLLTQVEMMQQPLGACDQHLNCRWVHMTNTLDVTVIDSPAVGTPLSELGCQLY